MSADDASWVFDSLIGFLQGPVWSAPILTFIEEKSTIFDAQLGVNEEEYRKIHEDYKTLVDSILGGLMDDMGITSEQFEQACNQPPPESGMPHFDKSLFEQVWAANDYQIFRRMMLQMNVELQLQTLEMIRQQTGAIPDCCRADDEGGVGGAEGGDEVSDALLRMQTADEDQIMNEVLRRSLEEAQAEAAAADADTLQLRAAVAAPREVQRLRQEVARERRRLDSALQHSLEAEGAQAEVEVDTEAASDDAVEEASDEPSHEDIQARQAYLQAQRDRLLALKKRERQRLLRAGGGEEGGGGAQAEAQGDGPPRPLSAHKTAQRALDGTHALARPVSARTLGVRRALAKRLKADVVGGR